MPRLRLPICSTRVGGDDFRVLFHASLELADATRVTERIVRLLGLPFAFIDVSVTIGASVGLARWGRHAHSEATRRRSLL
jgi:predicted signal transduction protein with EAL and GGDEF domain